MQAETPIERLTTIEKHFNLDQGRIYIKRDDKNHPLYGGNKFRKFEFIFGDVMNKKRKGIVTVGGTGTNHGLACALLCTTLTPSLQCDLFLFPQPYTDHVKQSLLLFKHFNAKVHHGKKDISALIKAYVFSIIHPEYYFIPPSGTPLTSFGSPLGTIGFINAAFELQMQINQGELPAPDFIFVAGSSAGTAAGLIAGCKLLGIKTKVAIISVYNNLLNNKTVMRNANKALYYLKKRDRSFPSIEISTDDFAVVKGYLGQGYGAVTEQGQNAINTIEALEPRKGIILDTTYTAKAMAAMLDFLLKRENKSMRVLFWNTYNSNDLSVYLD